MKQLSNKIEKWEKRKRSLLDNLIKQTYSTIQEVLYIERHIRRLKRLKEDIKE